jgi:hypothetical protein
MPDRIRRAVLLAAVGLIGCRRHAPLPAEEACASDAEAVSASASPASPTSRELPPLGGEWLVQLPLDGFGPAAVSVPLGATSPRGVVVGVHGRNDRPDWACGEWRGATDGRQFVLCPHGVPADAPPGRGLAFAGVERTRGEIDAGIEALKARFGPYVADGPMIYAGFSLGAILGVAIIADDPARFPIAMLGEGGQEEWTLRRVASFAKGGGRRVLFVCSTGGCEVDAARPMGALARAGVEVKLVSAGHIGHLVDDRVVSAVRAVWPWVAGEAPELPPR